MIIFDDEVHPRELEPSPELAARRGAYGPLFPGLPSFAEGQDNQHVQQALLALGAEGGLMDHLAVGKNPNNDCILAGFTYLGQFIAHDITFDSTTVSARQLDPYGIHNSRTPALNLDNLYGSGPAVSTHLYDKNALYIKFLIDKLDAHDPNSHDDALRNSQDTAVLSDPRDDDTVILSQLHLAFLKFHNMAVDYVARIMPVQDPMALFEKAQKLVRWHYQWIIVHEYLPLIVGEQMMKDVLPDTRRPNLKFYNSHRDGQPPYVPYEFARAAFRFGDSQVRPFYRLYLDADGDGVPIFATENQSRPDDFKDLRGGIRSPKRFVDWQHLFKTRADTVPQASKLIDAIVSNPLFHMPELAQELGVPVNSLPQLNLLRNLQAAIPSGQAIAAKRMVKKLGHDYDPLDAAELAELKDYGFQESTPLWYYVLKEAQLRAGGKSLGPVGGRIVAEVIIGLLEADRQSYLSGQPDWQPDFAVNGIFGMAELLQVAGLVA